MGRVSVHRYGDDTIDGELSIHVPRGKSVEDLLREVKSAFGTLPSEGLWLQLGQRYVIKEDDEVYRRYKGMNEISMYYTKVYGKGTVSRVESAFGSARTKMTKGAEKKLRRKAESVFVRLHWNPSNAKPRR